MLTFRANGVVVAGVQASVPLTSCGPTCPAASSPDRFTIEFETTAALTSVGSLVVAELSIPYGLTPGALDGTLTATSPTMLVVQTPGISNVVITQSSAMLYAENCPVVCFNLTQEPNVPGDFTLSLVDTANAAIVRTAIQANGASEVTPRNGLRGLVAGTYCYAVNTPLSVGRRNTQSYNLRFNWQVGPASGVTVPGGPTMLGNNMYSCGTDFAAPLLASPLGNHSPRGALADFDGDGNLDLVMVTPGAPPNQQLSVLRGAGAGAWRERTPLPGTFGGNAAVTAADFNGDGRNDILVLDASGSASPEFARLYLATAPLAFAAARNTTITGAINGGVRALVTADLDRDGDLDVVVAPAMGNGATVLGYNNGTFFPVAVDTDAAVVDLVAVEMTGDTQDDVLLLRGTNPSVINLIPSGNTISVGNLVETTAYTGALGQNIQAMAGYRAPGSSGANLAIAYVQGTGGVRTRVLVHNIFRQFRTDAAFPEDTPLAAQSATRLFAVARGGLTSADALVIQATGNGGGVFLREDATSTVAPVLLGTSLDAIYAVADQDFDGHADLAGRLAYNPPQVGTVRTILANCSISTE